MRGDPPFATLASVASYPSTPHARGSTLAPSVEYWIVVVYPACAGIHLREEARERIIECLPRMRGDPPLKPFIPDFSILSTPHARGSTPKNKEEKKR